MPIQSDISLLPLNTLGIPATAAHLFALTHSEALNELITHTLKDYPRHLILGGGSNILFAEDYDGLIIHNKLMGIDVTDEDDDQITVQVGAGEYWHPFVMHCLDNGWYGLENLSLIPGTVGASPIQNIGAYGVEVESCINQVSAVNLTTGKTVIFDHADCEFGYRSSIFKHTLKDQYCITAVIFKLSKQPHLQLSYGAIQSELDKRGILHPTPKDVSDVVIDIRQYKLPDPSRIPNAGSFFKNPMVDWPVFETIQHAHPAIPHYPQPNHQVKIPAAWLIEQSGLKGIRQYGVATYDKHALVIINPTHQTGQRVLELVDTIQQAVLNKFNILLEPEVNIIRR